MLLKSIVVVQEWALQFKEQIVIKNNTNTKKEEAMWSEALQEQTRVYFKSMPFACMKQIGGKFGICTLKDGVYIIKDRESDKEYIYSSIALLIEAKWAID